MSKKEGLMDSLIALCKRRGFVFPGSEIYGGLAGTWDYGPLGLAVKNNIKDIWWKRFVRDRADMYGFDSAILMHQRVWEASGHVSGFADPLVECTKCKSRFRADQIEASDSWICESCQTKNDFKPRQFNMMFKTHVGAVQDESSVSYLRPETAQGMFANFKNILDSLHPKLPFGLAQIGRAFRNEISPRDFLFRAREFEQMEVEYFVKPTDWQQSFETLRNETKSFFADIGLDSKNIYELEVPDGERAHYSKRTIDFEFDFPFGQKELSGLAYRTDFDLKRHAESSKVDLSYYDEEVKERFIPHVIEPSFGLDRAFLAVMSQAYTEDDFDGEKRVYLKLAPRVAPYKVAVFPLLRNKPDLVNKALELFAYIKKSIPDIVFDDNGNIGKRYRRQDEIGTPYCITVDFSTVEKNQMTVRDRDTGKQEVVKEVDIVSFLQGKIS